MYMKNGKRGIVREAVPEPLLGNRENSPFSTLPYHPPMPEPSVWVPRTQDIQPGEFYKPSDYLRPPTGRLWL